MIDISFQLVDHFMQMKERAFNDYNIKIHGGNTVTVQNYEENILKMQTAMRKVSYLDKPEQETGLYSFDGNELNPRLMKIFEKAQSQRQQNIINVIRHNDFNVGYDSKA